MNYTHGSGYRHDAHEPLAIFKGSKEDEEVVGKGRECPNTCRHSNGSYTFVIMFRVEQILSANRFGCSVRPGCRGKVVASCLFSPAGLEIPLDIYGRPA